MSDAGASRDAGGGRDARVPRAPDAASEPEACETVELVAEASAPDVLIVLDRSGSMGQSGGEPWDQAVAALEQLLSSYDQLRYGLALYPAVGAELACEGGDVVIAPAEATSEAVRAQLVAPSSRAIADHGYTPTAGSLERAGEALARVRSDGREQYVVLVTDGQPNCRPDASAKHDPDVEGTLAALDALRDDGVPTYVIGYRTDAHAAVMEQMAEHGGTARYLPAADRQSLLDALEGVASGLAPCTFTLSEAPRGPEYVRVRLDGRELSHAAGDFALEAGRTVSLGEARCEEVRDGRAHPLQVLVECAPVPVL